MTFSIKVFNLYLQEISLKMLKSKSKNLKSPNKTFVDNGVLK